MQNNQAMFANLHEMANINPWMLAELLSKTADRLPVQSLVATANQSRNSMHVSTHFAEQHSETRECSSQHSERGRSCPVRRSGGSYSA